MQWCLWEQADLLQELSLFDDLAPLLACWERKDHPAQVRMQKYLNALAECLGTLPNGDGKLCLHMDIDVGKHERLVTHYDLENYLTPVINRLGHAYFDLVSAHKRVGGGSRLIIGRVQPMRESLAGDEWSHFACQAGSGTTTLRWKKGLRDDLARAVAEPLPTGPVAVHLAWRCAGPDQRNWVGLWKPTGDAMGPILGWPQQEKHPFSPYDDRIVSLFLHRNVDELLGHTVDVGMWWRSARSSK